MKVCGGNRMERSMSVSVGRKTMEHELKILSEYFQVVSDGRKTLEFRRDDRFPGG